jgi:NAD/NADP transhydrogenase alpha subunit
MAAIAPYVTKRTSHALTVVAAVTVTTAKSTRRTVGSAALAIATLASRLNPVVYVSSFRLRLRGRGDERMRVHGDGGSRLRVGHDQDTTLDVEGH